MHNQSQNKIRHSLIHEIIRIVRDALSDGLIRGDSVANFNRKVKTLKGKELEDYLQRLWDKV